MTPVALHRADEAKWIERQPFFSRSINALTEAQREHVSIWGRIMDERAEMLPAAWRGAQPLRGRIITEVAV